MAGPQASIDSLRSVSRSSRLPGRAVAGGAEAAIAHVIDRKHPTVSDHKRTVAFDGYVPGGRQRIGENDRGSRIASQIQAMTFALTGDKQALPLFADERSFAVERPDSLKVDAVLRRPFRLPRQLVGGVTFAATRCHADKNGDKNANGRQAGHLHLTPLSSKLPCNCGFPRRVTTRLFSSRLQHKQGIFPTRGRRKWLHARVAEHANRR